MSDNVFEVHSSDHKGKYTVHVKESTCNTNSCCVPQCTFPECGHLCRNRIECTCYDYTHGHLCKHVHKVKMLLAMKLSDEDLSISDQDHFDESDKDQVDIVYSVASPKKQRETGLSFH